MNYKQRFKTLLEKYGATLVDATETLVLTVTKAHTKGGKPGDPIACPLVRSAISAGAVEVMVGNKIANIIFNDPKRKGRYVAKRYTLPKATSDMITIFDKTKVFEPGDYLFDIPSPGRRLDYVRPKKAATETRTYTKRPDRAMDPAAHTRNLSAEVV